MILSRKDKVFKCSWWVVDAVNKCEASKLQFPKSHYVQCAIIKKGFSRSRVPTLTAMWEHSTAL
jgi:hypothetical protein